MTRIKQHIAKVADFVTPNLKSRVPKDAVLSASYTRKARYDWFSNEPVKNTVILERNRVYSIRSYLYRRNLNQNYSLVITYRIF